MMWFMCCVPWIHRAALSNTSSSLPFVTTFPFPNQPSPQTSSTSSNCSLSPNTSHTWTRLPRHPSHYLNLPFPPFFVGSSAYIPEVFPCVPATSEYYPLTSLPACVPAFLLVNPSACKPCFSSLKYLLWIRLPLSLRLGPFCLCCFHQPWQNEGIAFAKMVFIPPLFMPRRTEATLEARGGPALLYIMLVSPLSPVSSTAVYIKVPPSLFHMWFPSVVWLRLSS